MSTGDTADHRTKGRGSVKETSDTLFQWITSVLFVLLQHELIEQQQETDLVEEQEYYAQVWCVYVFHFTSPRCHHY